MDKDEIIKYVYSLESGKSLLKLINLVAEDEFKTGNNKFNGFSMKQLKFYCNSNKTKNKYIKFKIKKKSGGEREIFAPCITLKMMQVCVNKIIQAVYVPSKNACGFIPNRSIVDGALRHIGKNYVFNTDLKDFFPSITQARVWKRFQLPPFNFNKQVSNILAGLCCFKMDQKMVLPQGAPSSPILTNAICDNLDRRLNGVAKRFHLTYSRYADDISFSSMHNVYQEGSEFREELKRIVEGQNFTINDKKTRLCRHRERQEVTGLTVNTKLNVAKKYVRELRVVLHLWETKGYITATNVFIPHRLKELANMPQGIPHLENIIDGKLNYLKMVKGDTDQTYCKLKVRFDLLVEKMKGITAVDLIQNDTKKTNIENKETNIDVDIDELLKIVEDFEQKKDDQ